MKIHTFKMTYKKKLLFSFSMIFLLFAVLVILMQYNREKTFKKDKILTNLKAYTTLISNYTEQGGDDYNSIVDLMPKALRVTIIDNQGKVFFDNAVEKLEGMDNHLMRPEIVSSAKQGVPAEHIRVSQSTGTKYLYIATSFDDCFIRVALPYNSRVELMLRADNLFFYVILLLFVIGFVALNYISERFAMSVSALKNFALHPSNDVTFPKGELGEIGKTIKANYNIIKQNQLQKQEITSNIAHELRTPISSVSGYLETILAHENMDEKQRHSFIKKAFVQIQRLTTLIADVSLLSKIESDDTSLFKEPMMLKPLVDEVVERFNAKISDVGANVKVNVPDDMAINANYTLISAVFSNLIENAIKYAGEGVTINIEVLEVNYDEVIISVWDDGCGVASEHLPKLFERFYRPSDGRTRMDGGSGLGLSIVKNAVLCHDGHIEARKRDGVGLEILFSIKK